MSVSCWRKRRRESVRGRKLVCKVTNVDRKISQEKSKVIGVIVGNYWLPEVDAR
jgi:hypothetical protein